MSTDLTAAHEALREILAGLDASVAHLREIADGLRDKPEPELPPEPEDGTRWLDADGCIWSRHDDRVGLHDLHRWRSDSVVGLFAWWGVLKCATQPLVQLVRADQIVVLPRVVPDAPTVEWKPSGSWLGACVPGDFDRLKITIRHLNFRRDLLSALIPLADAERWLLDVLALVRSKDGAR
jgi:hypothetical protein